MEIRDLLLNIGEKNYRYVFDPNELTKEQWLKHKSWKWYEEPPTERCKIFWEIWEKLRPQSFKEIQKQMIALKRWAGINGHVYAHYLPMNEKQLLDLSKNNLFKIGMHTHTHPDLQGKEKQFQVEEILSSKNILSNKYGIESNCLAYPYGRYDNYTIEAVNKLRVAACFTTEAVSVNINSKATKLGRYQVYNWSIEDFRDQLNIWSK